MTNSKYLKFSSFVEAIKFNGLIFLKLVRKSKIENIFELFSFSKICFNRLKRRFISEIHQIAISIMSPNTRVVEGKRIF